MGACVAWKTDPVADPEPATTGQSYLERLAELGVLRDAGELFGALDRGDGGFGPGMTAQEVVAEAKRRRGD